MKELEKFRCPCCNQKDTVVPNTLCSVCIDTLMSHHREVVIKRKESNFKSCNT